MKILATYLFISVVLSGCVTASVVPKNVMPKTPGLEIHNNHSKSTNILSCIKSKIHERRSKNIKLPLRVAVGEIPNRMGSIKGIPLPDRLKEQVYTSVNWLSGPIFEMVYSDLDDPTGLPMNPYGTSVSPRKSTAEAEAAFSQLDMIILGSLNGLEQVRSADIDMEISALGLSGKVQAYDLTLTLSLVDSKTRDIYAGPADLTVRVYSAVQGASFFLLHGDDFSRARGDFSQPVVVRQALKYLADSVVAVLFEEFAAKNFNVPQAACESPQLYSESGYVSAQYSHSSEPFSVQIYKNKNGICARAVVPSSISEKQYAVDFKQYNEQHLLTPILTQHRVSIEDVKYGLCMPEEKLLPTVSALEVIIHDDKNHYIAGDRISIRK